MLYKLLSNTAQSVFDPEVVSLTDIGLVGERIQSLGISVRALGMRRGIPNPLAVFALSRWLRQSRPAVIQTWMYHADLIGGIAAKLAGDIPVVWGIRHSNLEPKGNKRNTLWTARLCATLSRWLPARIVCCSEAARRVHVQLGYAEKKMRVIPNGFDLSLFKADEEARSNVRRALEIPEQALIIGLVARFDPQKDHRIFFQAAGILHKTRPDVHFLLCGDGITHENRQIMQWIEENGLEARVHLLGRRQDIPRLTAALDIASSSSFGEGFPNVIGEAMACAVPCVVTDVGDSALIVGETGKVVPPRNPSALAAAWGAMIEIGREGRRKLGHAARERIEENFRIETIAARYEQLYREVAS